ncbi:hypothetical protein V1280_003651 [Bradyrhizobium sp. AZCC 2230]
MQIYSSSEAVKQAVDCIDMRDCHLMEQAPRIRRDRLQVTALCFGVQRPNREG